jgi:hypothetical protein
MVGPGILPQPNDRRVVLTPGGGGLAETFGGRLLGWGGRDRAQVRCGFAGRRAGRRRGARHASAAAAGCRGSGRAGRRSVRSSAVVSVAGGGERVLKLHVDRHALGLERHPACARHGRGGRGRRLRPTTPTAVVGVVELSGLEHSRHVRRRTGLIQQPCRPVAASTSSSTRTQVRCSRAAWNRCQAPRRRWPAHTIREVQRGCCNHPLNLHWIHNTYVACPAHEQLARAAVAAAGEAVRATRAASRASWVRAALPAA